MKKEQRKTLIRQRREDNRDGYKFWQTERKKIAEQRARDAAALAVIEPEIIDCHYLKPPKRVPINPLGILFKYIDLFHRF